MCHSVSATPALPGRVYVNCCVVYPTNSVHLIAPVFYAFICPPNDVYVIISPNVLYRVQSFYKEGHEKYKNR